MAQLLNINKTETRDIKINIAIVITGIALVIGLIIYSRGGVSWFTNTAWSQVSIVKWIVIVVTVGIALVIQYYFLLLLRHSFVKYLVFWLLPIIWLFNNGSVAIHRLFESAAEETFLTGWIPITDLIGWLMGTVYVPLLVVGGIVVALIDSGGFFLAQACNIAGMALDITGTSFGDLISGGFKFIGIFLDLLGNSFMQEFVTENLRNRPFFDLSLSGVFSLPHWFYSAGYSFSCIIS